jgi:hypothetical protein
MNYSLTRHLKPFTVLKKENRIHGTWRFIHNEGTSRFERLDSLCTYSHFIYKFAAIFTYSQLLFLLHSTLLSPLALKQSNNFPIS